jgi:hypothetical protein
VAFDVPTRGENVSTNKASRQPNLGGCIVIWKAADGGAFGPFSVVGNAGFVPNLLRRTQQFSNRSHFMGRWWKGSHAVSTMIMRKAWIMTAAGDATEWHDARPSRSPSITKTLLV